MQPIIEVSQVTKRYDLAGSTPVYLSLRDAIAGFARNLFNKNGDTLKRDEFYALTNVSFTVEPGEIIGIIGPNGAGKSTLLKTLSRITSPTSGSVILRGRTSSLLDVGVGFHMELTGRENVYLNGVILGMTRKQIDQKFDAIVEFSGLRAFIDQPVKHYSSGMFVRLGFSIAVHLETDILILDEVLSVGDMEFQEKSSQKMKELITNKNTTIILVSHDLALIEKLCHKVLLLMNGSVVQFGTPAAVIDHYYKLVEQVH